MECIIHSIPFRSAPFRYIPFRSIPLCSINPNRAEINETKESHEIIVVEGDFIHIVDSASKVDNQEMKCVQDLVAISDPGTNFFDSGVIHSSFVYRRRILVALRVLVLSQSGIM
jgi:hypothetical protein